MLKRRVYRYISFLIYLLSMMLSYYLVVSNISDELSIKDDNGKLELIMDNTQFVNYVPSTHRLMADNESYAVFSFVPTIALQAQIFCREQINNNKLLTKNSLKIIACNYISSFNSLSINSSTSSFYNIYDKNRYYIYEIRHIII